MVVDGWCAFIFIGGDIVVAGAAANVAVTSVAGAGGVVDDADADADVDVDVDVDDAVVGDE